MPESSNKPCIAPSSPSLPCRTGNTTSRLIASYRPCSRTSNPWTLLSGDNTTGLPFSQSAPGPPQSFQAPSFVIPIQNGSYFSVSRCFATSCADLTETGCSSDVPPNMIPIFNLSTQIPAFKVQAVGNRVFDSVTQCVICVVSGVRTDEHIRHLLQPQQRFAFDGLVPAVGVEYSFLSFEDIQRRSAQSAAFQGWNEGLGIEE